MAPFTFMFLANNWLIWKDKTDARLTSDPGVGSSIPYFRGDWSWNNFYGHSHSAESFKKGCCQLQLIVYWRTLITQH